MDIVVGILRGRTTGLQPWEMLTLTELNGEYLMPNNYCLGEVESALGTKLLDRVDRRINREKRERAIYFIDEVTKVSNLLKFHRVDSRMHNYHLLVAEVRGGKRDIPYEKDE